MITVPLYLVIGQITLLLVACWVLASAYRRIAAPARRHEHADEAAELVGTPLPDLGPMVGGDGLTVPAPRQPGPGAPTLLLYVLPGCEGCLAALTSLRSALTEFGRPPAIHVVSAGADSALDNYAGFGFPVWRAAVDLASVLGLTIYPVFLAVDSNGVIRAAGSIHSRDAIRSYLAGAAPIASARPAPPPIASALGPDR